MHTAQMELVHERGQNDLKGGQAPKLPAIRSEALARIHDISGVYVGGEDYVLSRGVGLEEDYILSRGCGFGGGLCTIKVVYAISGVLY